MYLEDMSLLFLKRLEKGPVRLSTLHLFPSQLVSLFVCWFVKHSGPLCHILNLGYGWRCRSVVEHTFVFNSSTDKESQS